MAAGPVDLEITVGEDWTVQIESLDEYDRPRPLISHPARMDVKQGNSTLISLTSTDELDPEVIPGIAISNESAIIQLHIPRSASQAFTPGIYAYDLWVTSDDGDIYAGNQANPEIAGRFIVNRRVTESF